MGLDLTLVPIKYSQSPEKDTWWLGHDRIDLHRNYGLFGQIAGERGRGEPVDQVCHPRPLPEQVKFDWYYDEGVRETKKDSYGDSLTWLYASELAIVNTREIGAWNKAAFEFMKALPPTTPVVLWWH